MCSRALAILLSLVCISTLVLTFTSDELRVTLSNGSKLIGKFRRSLSGRPIKAFTNIPYAKPPVGPLRFKPLEPLEKWDGEYKAVNDGPVCPQKNYIHPNDKSFGDEDCMYLNVFVPHSYEKEKKSLPVLVVFHHGSFYFGSKNDYQPDYLLDKDIILVVGDYRIGVLGFLSTEDEHCPGNLGLKDQVVILKWVQENINRFGGDPDRVTIGGCSAGSAMVTYLMASPLTEGLFSKAISHAGSNASPWAQPVQKGLARQRATKLAEYFNCYTPNNWPQTIDCLRNVPAYNLTDIVTKFFGFDIDPMAIFGPVVEDNSPGAFITENPRDVVATISIKRPLLTGINYDDGSMRSIPILEQPGLFETFTSNLTNALSNMFVYNHHDSFVIETITNKILEFYFNNEPVTKEKELNLTNMCNDGWFTAPLDSYLRMRLADKDAAQTFVFLNAHKGSASWSKFFGGKPNKWYGVSHGDELLYLYPMREQSFQDSLPTEQDEQLRVVMVEMWTNFIITGNPTPSTSQLTKWEAVKGFPLNYYRLGNLHYEGKPLYGMEEGGLFDDRTKFWRELAANQPAESN